MFIILKIISVTVSIKGNGHYPAEIRLNYNWVKELMGNKTLNRLNIEPTCIAAKYRTLLYIYYIF